MAGYNKFYTWINQDEFEKVRERLKKKGNPLTEETRIPCRVLRPSSNIDFVPPSAWYGFCKRRTSWYHRSEQTGKVLLVSGSLQHLSDFGDPIVIMDSDFNPDRFPNVEEIVPLIKSDEYRKRKPPEWDQCDPLEKDFYQKWFERHQSDAPFDFDSILLSHSANHANFLDPQYFITRNGVKAPYSIAGNIHVCSSCLEFFNIIGSQWPVKYVAPCIGAVLFAHLPTDQYFKVETPRRRLRQA